MVSWDTRLHSVVGDKTAKVLEAAFDMRTVDDLLRHFPRRYAELGALTDLSKLEVGQHVTVMARVLSSRNYTFGQQTRGRPKVRTEVIITDGVARLSVTFFNQSWLTKNLAEGTVALFAGVVSEFRGTVQLTQPMVETFGPEGDSGDSTSVLMRGIIPIYPATAKYPSWRLAKTIELVLDVADAAPEPIPSSVRAARRLLDSAAAFEAIHRPSDTRQWQRARDRFRFEEAFVVQAVFARRRHDNDQHPATARPAIDGKLRSTFVQRLPFALTQGQQQVSRVIAADLERSHPMHRLLQGEVGSGKTVVALLAMLQVVDAGGQAALLAPTEVLAAQHQRSITAMLGDLAKAGMLGGAEHATRVRLITGSMGAKARQAALLDVQSGEAGIVIGTHAILEESVQFAELGLLVIDEQHRFGVEQRAALIDRAQVRPHVLVMTATPIPRTVAMTVFGDLETSTLSELPAGRQPIQTTVVPAAEHPAWLDRAWERIVEEVAQGRQAYVVVSKIGDSSGSVESGEPATRSLIEVFDELSAGPLRDLRLAMVHGRLSADEKDATMTAFTAGEIDVLVATTVIEVGVDVPNATVMVILDADRFGVSQLHQLRGRVGRGTQPGLCLLVSEAAPESAARERLDAVAATSDGFELSRIDVELRREGDVLGARQSGGRSSLKLLSVVRHEDVIARAREDATSIVAADPHLLEHVDLAALVARVEATEQAEFLERT